MRRFIFSLLMVIIPASAQWRHFGGGGGGLQATGYFGVGGTAAVNPLGNSVDTGWNLAGGIGVREGYLGIMVDATFNRFGINGSTLDNLGARSGHENFFGLTLDPVVHINPRGPADFYITGGGGFYGDQVVIRAPSGPRFDFVSSDTIYRPGVNAGAGFAFNVAPHSRVKFFMEARYHRIFENPTDAAYVPVTLGIRF